MVNGLGWPFSSPMSSAGFLMKGETPVNSTMSIGQARKMVEQLKIEASMCRIKVRKTTDGPKKVYAGASQPQQIENAWTSTPRIPLGMHLHLFLPSQVEKHHLGYR